MLQNNPDSITKYEGDGCDPLKRSIFCPLVAAVYPDG